MPKKSTLNKAGNTNDPKPTGKYLIRYYIISIL